MLKRTTRDMLQEQYSQLLLLICSSVSRHQLNTGVSYILFAASTTFQFGDQGNIVKARNSIIVSQFSSH